MTDPTDAIVDTEVGAQAATPDGMPLPSDPKTIFLGGLFVLALLAAISTAGEIVYPLMFAAIFKLLLQPVMRRLERWRAPRTLAALLLILLLLGLIVGVGTAISGPAEAWAAKLPDGVARLEERVTFLRLPINALLAFLHQVESIGAARSDAGAAAPAGSVAILTTLFSGASSFAGGLFTTLLLLYFLLVSGDSFLRRVVEILPSFSSKRQAVEISQQVESDISAYLVTITIMNLAVGIVTGALMWLTGVGDPVLWGTLAFLLNYLPIIGPTMGVVIFLLAGLLTMDTLWRGLLPAGLYLIVHLIEGETFTPMLLAKRFTLNPVLVIVSLVFWFWMGGIAGAILSVPMLAIAKIVCDRIRPLAALGHFLEG